MKTRLEKLLEAIEASGIENKQDLAEMARSVVRVADEEITKLQAKNIDIIKSRDSLKEKVKDIGRSLNVDLDTESVTDAINAIKANAGVQESEALKIKQKEIHELQDQVQSLNKNLVDSRSEYENEILQTVLERDLALVLPKYKAHEDMTQYIVKDIKEKAHFEEGRVLFKNEDGTTIRIDGADATIEDMVKFRKDNDEKGRFFDIKVQASGTSGSAGATANGNIIGDSGAYVTGEAPKF